MVRDPDPDPGASAADGPRPEKPKRKGFLLRLPPELLAELRAWSSQELRSLNGHIEFLLREAVRARRRRAEGEEPDPPEAP